jgi:D-alanyl-D-alanine carboxypeptidase (penicillin-binding protein 5/6)
VALTHALASTREVKASMRLCEREIRFTGFLITTILVVAAAAFGPSAATASPSPSISVPSGLLMTMDGHLLWSKNPTESRHVASTIKMLNALVVMDHARTDDTIVVARQAMMGNGGVGLVAGQKLTVLQLLNMMLIHSANDAARALAIGVAGSQPKFVAMMNAKARSLGLTHTHAIDPDGFSGREVSDAQDLSVLGRAVMANPVLRPIVGRASVPVPRLNGKVATYHSSDLLMGHYPGLEGVKTGFTTGAGFCYVGAAKRNGVELLGVVLGTASEAARFGAMRTLLDWGFARCREQLVAPAARQYVVTAGGGSVQAHPARPVLVTVFDDGGSVSTQVIPLAGAPKAAPEQVATLVVAQRGYVLARVPLVSDAAPAPSSPRVAQRWLYVGLILAVAAICAALVWFWRKSRTRAARLSRPLERASTNRRKPTREVLDHESTSFISRPDASRRRSR